MISSIIIVSLYIPVRSSILQFGMIFFHYFLKHLVARLNKHFFNFTKVHFESLLTITQDGSSAYFNNIPLLIATHSLVMFLLLLLLFSLPLLLCMTKVYFKFNDIEFAQKTIWVPRFFFQILYKYYEVFELIENSTKLWLPKCEVAKLFHAEIYWKRWIIFKVQYQIMISPTFLTN